MAKDNTFKVKKGPALTNEGEDIPLNNNEKPLVKTQLSQKKEDNKFALKNKFLKIACAICISLIAALVICAITSTVLGAYGMNTQPIDELQKTLAQALMLDLGFIFATKIDI